jgi:hypothetical protein
MNVLTFPYFLHVLAFTREISIVSSPLRFPFDRSGENSDREQTAGLQEYSIAAPAGRILGHGMGFDIAGHGAHRAAVMICK